LLTAVLLLVATPAVATPAEQPAQICKVVVDHPLKSRRTIACGTEEQWQAFNLALKTAKNKISRDALISNAAYLSVGSGY
jgi:hypothetical protein